MQNRRTSVTNASSQQKSPIPRQRLRSNSIKSDPGRGRTPDDKKTLPKEEDPKPKTKNKGPSLKRCPCGSSSGNHAWLLQCTVCQQNWHSSCANMKGTLPKETIEYLDHWQCPWCFICPYAPPDKHRSSKFKELLKSTVLSDALVSTIEDSTRKVFSENQSSVCV